MVANIVQRSLEAKGIESQAKASPPPLPARGRPRNGSDRRPPALKKRGPHTQLRQLANRMGQTKANLVLDFARFVQEQEKTGQHSILTTGFELLATAKKSWQQPTQKQRSRRLAAIIFIAAAAAALLIALPLSLPSSGPTQQGNAANLAHAAGLLSERAAPKHEEVRRYNVQKGDNLGLIANRLLGSPSHWSRIAQANPSIDPHRLTVGLSLVIPE